MLLGIHRYIGLLYLQQSFHSYAMPIEIATTQGLRAQFIPLGATLTSLFVKDRDGNEVDIVLGFDSLKGYEADTAYMGRTIGRVCNRIQFGCFDFHGRKYQLPINNPPHHLHGGPQGIALSRKTPKTAVFSEKEDEKHTDALTSTNRTR
ncbi:hypothetical protein TELCIR_15067 [Teladorsagia circumcincta]|uniref:Galactose mutarotase n=1 Tax=Teladorsagia circumcincta TaxID=45464 RepID=A0A2G9TZE7_TELCI|nr:hypothetical protein TELCIR_15067 [Teladorsagia circumcincta]